jgi:hypothetical protein
MMDSLIKQGRELVPYLLFPCLFVSIEVALLS